VPRSDSKLAPSFATTWFERLEVLEEAGAVEAHGVPNFPRYFTCQLSDSDLDYWVALHVQTSHNGSEVVGLQCAPRPDQPLVSVDMPSVIKVAKQLDAPRFLRFMVMAVKAERLGIRFDEVVGPETKGNREALQRLVEVLDAEDEIKPRRYRPRHGATLQHAAAVYRAAFAFGEHPTRAVQKACGPMGYSTASALVREARAAGLLPPATKGKPGWTEGES
jgi:hypothetical protein